MISCDARPSSTNVPRNPSSFNLRDVCLKSGRDRYPRASGDHYNQSAEAIVLETGSLQRDNLFPRHGNRETFPSLLLDITGCSSSAVQSRVDNQGSRSYVEASVSPRPTSETVNHACHMSGVEEVPTELHAM